MNFELHNASLLKRAAALILDLILLTVVATGGMLILSAVTDFDGYTERLEGYYAEYAAAHGIESFDITESEYLELPEEERNRYDAAFADLSDDEAVLRIYSVLSNLLMLIPSLGIFFAYAVMEFALPLLLRNGQTVGKKVFGLGVIRCDGVKMTPFMLFARTFLGKFTVETMLPIMFIVLNGVFGQTGLVVIGLIALLDLLLLLFTRHRTVIHDAFAQTVVVELAAQLVFDTPEALLEYQKQVAAERAERAEYR